MRTSENIADLAAALAKAQAAMKHATKGAENPYFKSKYADLAAVVDACRKALTDNGLSVLHGIDSQNAETVVVTCRLLHSSGQWIESSATFKPTKTDPQSIGSAITYARRYTLAAMVGVATEDDDGNAASQPDGPPKSVRAVPENDSQEKPKGGVVADRETLVAKVVKWAGVSRDEAPAVVNQIKAALGIAGTMKAADYPRVIAHVEALTAAGVQHPEVKVPNVNQ